MKTIKFLIALSYGIFVANFLSCAPKAFPVDSPNPLDEPGSTEPTAKELELENIRAITSNPGYQAR